MQSFIPMHLKLEIKWANSLKKQLTKTNMRRQKKSKTVKKSFTNE